MNKTTTIKSPANANPNHIIRFENINKTFSRDYANKNISFSINRNEIHGLIGENGSGKSTLMLILFGLVKPDSGNIYINNQLVKITNSKASKKLKIGMLKQHFDVVDSFTVWQNVALGNETTKLGFIKGRETKKRVQAIIDKYGFKLNVNDKASSLNLSQKQMLEIIKILYYDPEILIFDEPTSILSLNEIKHFSEIVREFKAEGKTVIFITHKLNEILDLVDRFTILRKGEFITTKSIKSVSYDEISTLLVGGKLKKLKKVSVVTELRTKPLLEVKDLHVKDINKHLAVNGVSFKLYPQEIFAVSGAAGNGQQELMDSIVGFLKPVSGKIIYKGKDVTHFSVKKRQSLGMNFCPADRLHTGLMLEMPMVENMLMGNTNNRKFIKYGVLKKKAIFNFAKDVYGKYDIRGLANYKLSPLNNLSGGNLQKILVGRGLETNKDLFVTFQPTWGIDIKARNTIHKYLLNATSKGASVLLISYDLDEIFILANHITVIYRGKFGPMHNVNKINNDIIAKEMVGGS